MHRVRPHAPFHAPSGSRPAHGRLARTLPSINSASSRTRSAIFSRTPEDFDAVFAALVRWQAQAVIVEPAALSGGERNWIAELAMRAKLPTLFSTSFGVRAGGLLYGPNHFEIYDREVVCTDRLLRCARAAAIPVETPKKLDLIPNLKTARMLGLSSPRSILVRADSVLE